MTDTIVLKAPAKLNVTLEVIAKRSNGYHSIRSIFVRLDKLADTVTVQLEARKTGIRITTNSKEIPADAANICHRAAVRYLDEARETAGIHIHIEKAIPVAAGLGGGSSDAAAVLLALNRHWRRRLPPRELAALGSDIGKDIPFFLGRHKSSYVSGMGEIIERLPAFPRVHFLVVNPGLPVSTQAAYQALEENVWFMADERRADRSRAMVEAIEARDIGKCASAFYNDFESLIERQHPVVKEAKQALLAFGARGALMSGSGPTVFGLFDSTKALLNAEDALRKHYPSFVIAKA